MTGVLWAFLVAQMVKNLPAMQSDLGSIPGIGKVPGEGNGYPLQDSCLKNSMNRGALHGASMRWTRLSNKHFPFHWSDLVATVEM